MIESAENSSSYSLAWAWSSLQNMTDSLRNNTNKFTDDMQTSVSSIKEYASEVLNSEYVSDLLDLDPKKSHSLKALAELIADPERPPSLETNTSTESGTAIVPSDGICPNTGFNKPTPMPEMAVKNIFRKALLALPFTPVNINYPKETFTNPSATISSIIALTALQHLVTNYYNPPIQGQRSSPQSIYTRISKNLSIGSVTGTFVSWAFNYNPIVGAGVGVMASIPIGLTLDYTQEYAGDPAFRVIEKAATKLMYGGRTFLEFTLASIISPLVFKATPSVSENSNINFIIKFSISAFSSLTCLRYFESAYPSPPLVAENPQETTSSFVLSTLKHAVQTLAVSSLVLNYIAHVGQDS